MNKHTAHVLWFNQISKTDIAIAGGKGANLGEMTTAGIPVPNGFVVTATAYYDFLAKTSLKHKILTELSGLDHNDSAKLNEASKRIKTAVLAADLPSDLAMQIKDYYHTLCGEHDRLVAVRSSATAEDLPDASFAGQQETYLNIAGWQAVVTSVQKCWASLFESRAIFYRSDRGFSHFKIGIAVPVQLMVQSDVSGIMFTVNPMTNNRGEISIEAAWGLGQPVVSGEITPDQYLVDKKTAKISYKHITKQTWQMTLAGNIAVSRDYQEAQKLSDAKVKELAKLGAHIESHYGKPQDIEWGMEAKKLYIVQSRPVTTLKQTNVSEEAQAIDTSKSLTTLLTGLSASPGITSGKVRIVKSPKEIGIVEQGDVLVAEMTNPDYVPAMRKACAIVTDSGGKTSHAAIVSRELGVPAVVGSGKATTVLKDGMVITVDGTNGNIYAGNVVINTKVAGLSKSLSQLKTATKVYVNLAEPQLAQDMAARNVDGVGLLRAEFIIANIGTHPKKFIKEKRSHEFVKLLADDLEKFARAFEDRPVVYRFTDFKTNEYRSLAGGAEFEGEEPNPLIGFRGAGRYIEDPHVFNLEVEAVKLVRNKRGCKNLHVMIPFVRTVEQLREVKKLISTSGLRRSGMFKLWMMVEIPSNVILLDAFIDEGIDGVSIGTNDLTMLILGVDRDNAKVANVYSELDPAVLWALEKIVTTCKKRKITCSVCGQAPSEYPQLVEKLVKWGVSSVSVSPDVVEKTRGIVYTAEHQLVTK
jgi:pyruvate,water dikinase